LSFNSKKSCYGKYGAVASRISEFLDERGCEDPVMTLPIKKRINTDMFIDKTEALDIYRLAMPCTGPKILKVTLLNILRYTKFCLP